MGLFSKKRQPLQEELEKPELEASGSGPFDFKEVASVDDMVNLGSIFLPVRAGMGISTEGEIGTNKFSALSVILEGQVAQLMAVAAPKSSGLWTEIRKEIVAELKTNSLNPALVEGSFGPELVVNEVADAKGEKTTLRFVGIDGPNWFLRVSMRYVSSQDCVFDDFLSQIVVFRDASARPPREVLPVVLPDDVYENLVKSQAQSGDNVA